MFLICGEEIKVHCVFDESILFDVIENLEKRFGKNIVSDKKQVDRQFVWDPGGAVTSRDVMLKFKIDDKNSVYCRAQHWPTFKQSAQTQLALSKYDDKFYKLHGHLFSACLTKPQRDMLLNEIERNAFKCDEIAKISVANIDEYVSSFNNRKTKLE